MVNCSPALRQAASATPWACTRAECESWRGLLLPRPAPGEIESFHRLLEAPARRLCLARPKPSLYDAVCQTPLLREAMMKTGYTTRVSAACAMAVALAVSPQGDQAEQTAVRQIERYCTVSWRNAGIAPQDWPDCTGEAFARLLARVGRERLGLAIAQAASPERRELNRSIWSTVQRWRRARPHVSLERQPAAQQAQSCEPDECEALAKALHGLPPQQRKVVELWSHGWSIAQIAHRMRLPAARISDLKYKALRGLRRTLGEEMA